MVEILLIVFWACFSLVAYSYILYPFILWVLGNIKKPETIDNRDPYIPSISLLISAYNEAEVIKRKIMNSLSLDYPINKIEIIVISDGSTDTTVEIANSFRDQSVKVLQIEDRVGKTEAQNQGVENSTCEILIFSDANAMYQPDAAKRIADQFSDSTVGGVCGQLVYADESNIDSVAGVEAKYWKMEHWIKTAEAKLNILTGANGSIYAVRRENYIRLEGDIISDFIEPLHILEQGAKVVYEPLAVSIEPSSKNIYAEYSGKRRIIKRSIYGLLRNKRFLNPARFGLLALALISHKVLRWLTPLLFVLLYTSSVFLVTINFYAYIAITITFLLFLGILGLLIPDNRYAGIINSLSYILIIAISGLVATIESLLGRSESIWEPKR